MGLKVALVEPETPGNIGAVARAMLNFGFEELVLVNPRCNHLSQEALARAKHASKVLERARVTDESFWDEELYRIGATARLGTDYNLNRSPLTPEELAAKPLGRAVLVIGSEGSGLTNEELARCDCVVSIPSNQEYPVLNVSHAAAVILYELSKPRLQPLLKERFKQLGAAEKEVLFSLIDQALQRMSFNTPSKRETQRKAWRRVLGKANLTMREGTALIGFFKKLLKP